MQAILTDHPFDLLVVGGGINGAGIARDAAGRGLSVLLVEQDDLAAHTSSWSTKLIHGGLRYLEYYEFRLVREALMERERLLDAAPHIIRPLRFVLPHDVSVRPAWMVRMGLFLYDHLARRKRLEGCVRLDLSRDARGTPLEPLTKVGFAYSDCAVDDSRLVVLNAMDARERGAQICVGTRLEDARREGDLWRASLASPDGTRQEVRARILVNAAGPWVAEVLNHRLGLNTSKGVRLVKGSHIVVPRLYEGDHAYILQNPDRRIVFAIPYQDDLTLVGTTDVPYEGAPHDVEISEDETDYLIGSMNHWFRRKMSRAEIVWTYSGVRPLFDDGSINASAVTRDYVFDIDTAGGSAAPLLSVFGGKLTTYRKLAEHVMSDLAPFLPGLKPAWTATAILPGGDIAQGDVERFAAELAAAKPFLGKARALRLAHAYGTRVSRFLDAVHSEDDLGRDFGGGLTAAELTYLKTEEWARTSRDVLWRRSKLGLKLPAEAAGAIDAFLSA